MVVGRINEKLLDHNCYQLKDYLIIIRLKPSKMSFVVKYTFLISPRLAAHIKNSRNQIWYTACA